MSLVRYESRDHVATITMDRASVHNALNNALCEDLRQAWLRFRDSDDRVAVLASCRGSLFLRRRRREGFARQYVACGAGAWRRSRQAGNRRDLGLGGWRRLCAGADGRSLHRVGRPRALSIPRARSVPPPGGISSVVSRMPHRSRWSFSWSARSLPVERAYQIGFVNKIAPKGQHLLQAQEMAAKIAGNAPLVVQALKKLARLPCRRGRWKPSPKPAASSTRSAPART